ncbi:MAG: hypothetical protein JWN96_2980 [Mycobacterium sp.]|nr:hypothetical protein [Mycobacterium sp.]
MKNSHSLSRTPESEWRLLRQEANRLNNVIMALRSGGEAAALAAVDAPDQAVPVQRRRVSIPVAIR